MAVTRTGEDTLFALPPTIAGRHRRLRNRITAVGAVLVLIAAVVVVWIKLNDPTCVPGIARIDDECIGVTTGDFAFHPDNARFSAAENRIRDLNHQVETSGKPYVTVALLSSLTWSDTSALSAAKISHQLEGAAVALDRVDNKGVTGDAPLIELLLANEGTDEVHYDAVVQQLIGMAKGEHPLDAVIGLGVSNRPTIDGTTELSKAGILMVGSNLTGDDLDSAKIPGLSRVSTPNQDDVAAVAGYLATRPELHRTMLVHAASGAQAGAGQDDDYATTLAADFQAQLGKYATVPSEPFDQTIPGNSFKVIATNLCTSHDPPNVVLYGGREPDLPQFVQDLAQRPCGSVPITLVVGDDSCTLTSDSDDPQRTQQIKTELTAGKITVLCPAWAAPQNWAASTGGDTAPAGFADFLAGYGGIFTTTGEFGTQLDDGYAIMTHDALLTATNAIRLASQPSAGLPTPGQVLGNQYHMDAANTVRGASGTLTFVEANNGNPSGKPVFVLQVQPSGPPTLLSTYQSK